MTEKKTTKKKAEPKEVEVTFTAFNQGYAPGDKVTVPKDQADALVARGWATVEEESG